MNHINKINSLSSDQLSQVLQWFAADMLDELGMDDMLLEDIEVNFPADALGEDAHFWAKNLLENASRHRAAQVENYLNDAASVRGLFSSDMISSILPLALALYFSLEFKYEIVTHQEDGNIKKKKTIFSIKSRNLTETLRKLLE